MTQVFFGLKRLINNISIIAALLFGLISCKKNDLPVAAFNISVGAGPTQIEVQLINKSTNAVSYRWDVDGKTVSHDLNPAKLIFNGPHLEKILITLEVTDKFGQKSIKTSDLAADFSQ